MGLVPPRKRRPSKPRKVDALRLAATWDLLAACLQAGLPVPTAISAVSEDLSSLRDVAEQLALGADPRQAWAAALDCPHTKDLARAARRTARSGAGLAEVAARLAAEVRDQVEQQAEARAQRASVLITLPLGLCYLPAFLTLGVLPVVLGLTARTFDL
ncbi:type II secretion system F family protein [Actinokineospora diospyrosa]|nr:type II secretion system F family protein [Actinokineospora diospyrosa]